MPAYPIPPWLRPPPDPGEEYIQAVHAGASIAGQQAQLQASAAQAQQQHEMEKQRLEISKQYQQLQIGLQQQELKQKQDVLNLQTQEAARRFQAHQTYKQLIGSGMDPAKALLQVGPDLGISMVGAAQLYKGTQPHGPPQFIRSPSGEEVAFNPNTGQFGFPRANLPKEGTLTQMQNKQISNLEAQIRQAEKAEIPLSVAKAAKQGDEDLDTVTQRLRQQKVDALQSQIDAILGGQAPPPPGAAPVAPTPAAPGSNAPIKIISIRPKEAKPVSDEERAQGIADAMSQWKGFGG